jgi:hypothetical protein
MSVRIVIRQNGVFDETHALVSDLVFWLNEDTSYPSHSPFGLKVASGGNSNAIQPDTTKQPIAQPKKLEYRCTEHPTETGVLNLYNDFKAVSPTVKSPAPRDQVGVATGGRSPYTMSAADVTITPATPGFSLALIETPPGGPANAGITAVLTNVPAGAFTVTFTLTANDSLDNEIVQIITITVTY